MWLALAAEEVLNFSQRRRDCTWSSSYTREVIVKYSEYTMEEDYKSINTVKAHSNEVQQTVSLLLYIHTICYQK